MKNPMTTRSCPKCLLLMARCDFKFCPDCGAQLDSPSPSDATDCSRQPFRYVDVTSPGAEETLNLFFEGDCVAWVDNKLLAERIRNHLRESDQVQQ